MRPSPPVIKLSLDGQGPSSIRRVDPRKYDDDIVNELRRRAIEMAREQKQTTSCPEEEERYSISNSIHDQLPDDLYKVILKYKDVDGEECMIVTRDDISELMHQYAKFANVKVYAQVQCKSDSSKTTIVDDESRDEVEATTAVSEAAKNQMRNDAEDCRDVTEETSILAEKPTNLRPFRRSLLGLLAHKSIKRNVDEVATGSIDCESKLVISETAKRTGRKKFSFRIPMKMRIKKGPFHLASVADPMKTSHKNKDGAALDKTSGDGAASSNSFPKEDITEIRSIEPLNDTTQLHVATTTSAVAPTTAVAADNTLQPVLFLDKNGKAVTKIVQEMKSEAISLFHYASGIKRSVAQGDNNSILQCGAKGRLIMSCKGEGDREPLCITPPLAGLCQDCGAAEGAWDIQGATACCLPSVIPTLDATSNRAQVGVTALRNVNAEMMSMDLAEMASIFSESWWPTSNAKDDFDVATTFHAATELPSPVRFCSRGSGPLLADEPDMQKAMQCLFLASNDLVANRTGVLLHSASHTSGLSTVEELDEESNASVNSSLGLQQKVGTNGRSAFQNYENDDISETKISSSNSNRGNNTQYNNNSGIYSISQSISDGLFSNWSATMTLGLPVIKEADEVGPEIDRGDDGFDGCVQDNLCLDHSPSASVIDALLSHLSILELGGAEKTVKKERKNRASAATRVLRHKLTRARSNGSSARIKLRPSALMESDDISCSPSLTDPTMPSALGGSTVKCVEEEDYINESQSKTTVNGITPGVSTADSKDCSTNSVVEHSTQLGERHNSTNNAASAAVDEHMQHAMWLTNLPRTSSVSEYFSSLSTFSVLDGKLKRTTSEFNENGASEWSQESYAGFLFATLSGPIQSPITSPNIDFTTSTFSHNIFEVMPAASRKEASCHSSAVNEDDIPLTLSSTSYRSRSMFKKKSYVQEDEKSLNSSRLKKNQSNSSCRSSVKAGGPLSLSDDVSQHSALIKKVQTNSSIESKQGEVTQSWSTANSPAVVYVDAILSTLSSATGKSKPESASGLSSSSTSSVSSLGQQPLPNMNAVLARSIEDAESIAGLLRSSLSGPALSAKPKSAALDENDNGGIAVIDINDRKEGDGEDAASDDDDTVSFNLTDFLADFDDISAALSGPLTCSASSGQDEGTVTKNNDSEEENILFYFTKEVEKQQQQQQHNKGSVLSSFPCEELPPLLQLPL